MTERKSDARTHRTSTALGAKFIEVLIRFTELSAVVGEQLFGRENEISCHPPARWPRLYRRRPLVCPLSLCVRPRLKSEQIRRRLFRNRRDPFRFPRARRVALVASRFGSQESDQDPDRQN